MSLAIAILAAGSGRRFGGGKVDAIVAGKPLGQWALDAALSIPHDRLAVVVGEPAPQFARGCDRLVNQRAAEGLGTSAATAARWAQGSDALLIMLADMPLISPATLRKLAAALTEIEIGVGDLGIDTGEPKSDPWLFWWMPDVDYSDRKRS